MSSSLQKFLCEFDYRNEKIMDRLQREDSFSFILSYLLVVKVGQLFSIIQHKCQTIRVSIARNLWGTGFCSHQHKAEVHGFADNDRVLCRFPLPLNLQLFVWTLTIDVLLKFHGAPTYVNGRRSFPKTCQSAVQWWCEVGLKRRVVWKVHSAILTLTVDDHYRSLRSS